MKKPSLKDKLLSAASIEAAHQKLVQNTPAPPKPVTEPQPLPEPEIPTPTRQAVERNTRPSTRNTASNYAERNVRITVDMPESLHDRVKLHTVLQKQSIRDFILNLVERELTRK